MHLQEKNKVSKNGVKPPLKFGILKDSSGSRRIVFLAIEGGLNFRGKKKFQFEEYVNSWRLKLAMLYDIRYCYTSIKSVTKSTKIGIQRLLMVLQ